MARPGRLRLSGSLIILTLLAEVLLVLASGLLGAGLGLQTTVTAARTAEARAEEQAARANQERLEDSLLLEQSLRNQARLVSTEADKEVLGTGGAGIPGRGARAAELAARGAEAVARARFQSAQTKKLAREAELDLELAQQTVRERRQVVLVTCFAGIALLIGFGLLSIRADKVRRSQQRAAEVVEEAWRAGVAATLSRLEAQLAAAQQPASVGRGWRLWRR